VLGEESTHRNINPGRAMIMGTLFLTVWYTFLMAVFQGVSSQANVLKDGTDVLAYAGQLLVPGFWGRALPLAVLVAVIGTCQIQMTEPSRVLYALARDKLIPKVFGFIQQEAPDPVGGAAHLGRNSPGAADSLPGQFVGQPRHW
jgi:amino acid transporter